MKRQFVSNAVRPMACLVEGFRDTAFEHPAAKLRDVVTKVRALLAYQPAQLSHTPAARRA